MSVLRLAIVGAGPVGLALALHAARALPGASVSLFDSRSAGRDPSRDPRIIALSLGSIRHLQRLKAWPAAQAQPIEEVHVSQQGADPVVRITALEEHVPQLGAVLRYGEIVGPLEQAWLAEASASNGRLTARFACAVERVCPREDRTGSGVTVVTDKGDESFDLAVLAEGGVFAEQRRKRWSHDYHQNAWVGQVRLKRARPGAAYERFTAFGPAALLPLQDGPVGSDTSAGPRAALVWCRPEREDPIPGLSDAERVAALNATFHTDVGGIDDISPLKCFPLGLNAEPTLSKGRIIHIGNAAQTLHPVAGQGLNLGLRDAWVLVDRLAKSGAATRASTRWIDEALRSTEFARNPDRWTMIAATHFLAQAFTWRLPGAPLLSSAAFAGLQRLKPARSLLARRMMFGA